MRRIITEILFMLVYCLCVYAHAGEDPLYLVRDGRATATIVIPEGADKWTIKAAQWLNEYVYKATGAELTIFTEDKTSSGTLISVGHTNLAQKAGVGVDDFKWDGCKLIVKESVLYLIGRDQIKDLKTDAWIGAKGTCKAVLTFLEDFCGVRWFLPTPQGELVPKSRNISVPGDFTKTFIPAFAYTDGRSVYNMNILDEPGGTPASIANNFRKGVIVEPGGHTYYAAVPAEKYFKEHPEYFALINGKRTGEGNHLCSTNPDVKRILAEYNRMRFDKGTEWASLGQEDGYQRCECSECEKLDSYRYNAKTDGRYEEFMATKLRDNPPERLFLLHKGVIDELKKSHPDKKVVLMCYAPTAWPSKKISYFGDNVIGELMNPNKEYIDAWRDKVAGLVCKVDWFNIQCPMGMNVHMVPKEVSDRIRYMHKSGFVGLAVYPEANWGLSGPIFYMMGKLIGDPSLDYNALIEEYCRGVYGKAGNSMLQFFSLLYGHLEKVLPPLDADDILGGGRNTELPKDFNTTEMYITDYPPIFLEKLEQVLKNAEGEADSEQSRGWVKLTREYFDFIKLLTHALISYRTYQKDQIKENWLKLKKDVEAFDAYRIKIVTYPKDYTDIWFPGHGQFCNWMTADLVREQISYYTPWEQRKPDVLKKGIKGTAMGHGESYYHSYVKEPLTLDFSEK